ncbi:LysR family transcriptional regulator [Sinorhizobium fredii]|uniref:Transcriptional regulator n=3 Tax=Sinorhizobium/Ensifer group TaxID=227292 RepID=A0A2S3YJ95_9HYPH|nr:MULTISPECIES: LysR family transcriptional regulator [Sinorhizobium]AUX79583.1 LysR family transcriptional regulator protein [Sinorhizobium fredii]PDT41237.1 transcriptional regulator [Sinorhizobium sp. FG01]POH27437.1 transcriptional regulator [Sinorhizobium americanum]
MQARQLEVFCMLMRCGTVTSAASMLNISQPALSQILLHAEDQLGFKLFSRIRGKLVPTREAEELYPECERIFAELGALRRRTTDMRFGRTGLIRVAASAPPAMSIVPKALLAFRAAHPDVVVRSLIAPLTNIVDMIQNGDAPLGVVMNDGARPGIEVETLGHAVLVCIVPENHRLSESAEIGFADLQNETLISYRAGTLPGRLLLSAAAAEKQMFNPAIEIDISITALPFVRDGFGVAIVDGLLPWEQFPGLVRRPLKQRTTVPIALLTSKDRPLTGSHSDMRDNLRDACAAVLNADGHKT